MFAVRSLRVKGATPAVAKQVERALADTRGESLLAVDLAAARSSVESVPTVASASFDRAYPHTLEVRVVPERPVAVLRQGAAAYVVSARGRVVARVRQGSHPDLARIWSRVPPPTSPSARPSRAACARR